MTAAPVSQTITNTRLSGPQTFTFQNTADQFTEAKITIDRTVNGGLNSLAIGTTLDVSIDYSPDGGTTWRNIAGATWLGGTFVTKGVTATTEELGVGIGQPFPIGTGFRFNTNASTPVRIAGTIVYSYDY